MTEMNVYSIQIECGNRTIPTNAIEFILGGDDWIRVLNGHLYLVYSDAGATKLVESLRKVLHDDDSIFVVELTNDSKVAGFFTRQAWDWLSKYIFVDFLN